VSLAQLSLDDVKACTYNLGTVEGGGSELDGLTIAPIGGEIAIELKRYNADTPTLDRASAPSLFLTSAGLDLDNALKVLDVKLKTVAKISANRYIGHVAIRADRPGNLGPDEITQSFPIYIATNSVGKILYCYGNYASGGLVDLQQKQCETMMGEGYYWNPKLNKCDTRFETKCFPGNNLQASCDPATTFGLSYQVCKSSGYVDPFTPIDSGGRTYLSGAVLEPSPPGPYACRKLDANTVQCDYASDVDYSGATCSACCLVEKQDAIDAGAGAGGP
jgi:hypothetical protein